MSTRPQWWVPTSLILVSAVPVAAGAYRMAQLIGGAAITPENARFFASPAPVTVHIVTVTGFTVLGAFQFVPRLRRHRWHRVAGRVLIPCGLLATGSGLWMTLFYPRPENVGDLLEAFRLVFGTAMAGSLVLGLAAIRRRDVARHRAWLIRAYAIALGAGTQAVFIGGWTGAAGAPGETTLALLHAAAWGFNLGVAELLIRRVRDGRAATRSSSSPAFRTAGRTARRWRRPDPSGAEPGGS